MTELTEALASPRCVVSVMGSHAGEEAGVIFERKKSDIVRTGRSFWLIRSPKARPAQVQELCSTPPGYAIFVEPSTKGGARPTTQSDPAVEYSSDKIMWQRLPVGISPVTGKMGAGASALIFETINTNVHGVLDLWEYSEYSDIDRPLRFILGCSTVCAVRRASRAHPERMKSRFRDIVAVARLKEPYCVWVR